MPLSPIRVPGQRAAMEIRFCTICNESIPDGEFETGRAIQAGKKSQHVACGLKRAAEMNGPRSWLTSVLALYAAGVATFFLVSTLAKTDAPPPEPKVPEIVEARLSDVVTASEERQLGVIDTRLDRLQKQLDRTFSEKTLKAWSEKVQKSDQALDDRMSGLFKQVHERFTAVDARLTAAEERVTRLTDWFQRIQDQADQMEKQMADARAKPAPAKVEAAPPNAGQGRADPAPDPQRAAAVKKWIDALKDSNGEVVFTATIELGKLKDLSATDPLIHVLEKHNELWPRLGAATSLGDLRAVKSVPALIVALQDKEELVRSAAANALRGITEQDFDYVQGLSRSQRTKIQGRYKRWWGEHEDELRARLQQPK